MSQRGCHFCNQHPPSWIWRIMKVINLSFESHQPSLSQRQRCLDGWLHNFACVAGRLIRSSVPAIRQERIDSLPCAHEASRNALARHFEAFDAASHQKMLTSVVLHLATQICCKNLWKSVRESSPVQNASKGQSLQSQGTTLSIIA